MPICTLDTQPLTAQRVLRQCTVQSRHAPVHSLIPDTEILSAENATELRHALDEDLLSTLIWPAQQLHELSS